MLERFDQTPRTVAAIEIGDQDGRLRRLRFLRAEDAGEDREEDDRNDEAEHEGRAIAAEVEPYGSDDRDDHSRRRFPVSDKKTFASDGDFMVRSRTALPCVSASRITRSISAASSIRCVTRDPSANSTTTSRLVPMVFRTSSSFVPVAMTRPESMTAMRSQRRSASSM